jgi:hypothetical protein
MALQRIFSRGGDGYRVGNDSMITHQQTEIPRALLWPRVRNRPRCSLCSDAMVAPEASVLQSGGRVSYLWSCDTCGQGFVTHAHPATGAAAAASGEARAGAP